MKRPKYLEHADLVQDAIEELRWANLYKLAEETNLTYQQVSRATRYLREKCRVHCDRIEGKLVFFAT
jgi:hypothetical protein